MNAALAGEPYKSDGDEAKQKEKENTGWLDSDTSDMVVEPPEWGLKELDRLKAVAVAKPGIKLSPQKMPSRKRKKLIGSFVW